SVLPGPESIQNQESEKSPKEIIRTKKEKGREEDEEMEGERGAGGSRESSKEEREIYWDDGETGEKVVKSTRVVGDILLSEKEMEIAITADDSTGARVMETLCELVGVLDDGGVYREKGDEDVVEVGEEWQYLGKALLEERIRVFVYRADQTEQRDDYRRTINKNIPRETMVFSQEDGNPARAYTSNQAPCTQDGDPLQDDVRLCLGDDLKKAQDHSQRQV
ncbi:hypothetical protein Tco_1066151, partial [Tanacetum coccineum]